MPSTDLVALVATELRNRLKNAESGHDWWHVQRAWRVAETIQRSEGGDATIVSLGALLHDIADWKFHDGDEDAGPNAARELLTSLGAPEKIIKAVVEIVEHISFKGAGVASTMQSLEGKIVQDADRLDALGAMGIARAFSYGGFRNRLMYDPDVPPTLHATSEAYKKSTGTTINHFYEKLLLLKDRMNTETGKRLAEQRHQFLEKYLEEFFAEWNGTV